MIRAILLANATAATLNGRLASSAFSQGRARSSFRAIRRTAVAPRTSRTRSSGLPILEIPPSRSLPPLEWGFGVNPTQAAKWRADLNPPGSGTRAFMVAAVMASAGPAVAADNATLGCHSVPGGLGGGYP